MRREKPIKRTYPPTRANPRGRVAWVARYTNTAGHRVLVKPRASFPTRHEAQAAIDAAYGTPERFDTLGDYAETWTERHPRGVRTNTTNRGRVRAVLDLEVGGRPLAAWPLDELKRRQAKELVGAMLTDQGRAPTGAANIIRTLGTMFEDAIDDEFAEVNPFRGVRVLSSDPRATKSANEVRVWSFDDMRAFAAAGLPNVRAATQKPNQARNGKALYYSAVDYEPMLLAFALTNLRIGEVLALQRDDFDGQTFHVKGNAYNGVITLGDTPKKRHVRDVPCPPSLAAAIERLEPNGPQLFPTPAGQVFWDRNFRRDVWEAAQRASGLDIRPHECRHSWVTHMRAAGIDPADLAAAAGHDVDTATKVYTKPLGRSADAIRRAIG